MKNQFPGWNPPSGDELEGYWAEGVIAVDANVLLNAYRYSRSTRDDLLAALNGLGDRLRLPHRAAEDFHRNRMKVLLEQRICGAQLESRITRAEDDLADNLDEALRAHGRRERDSVVAAVKEHFSALKKEIRRIDREHHKGLGDRRDHRNDPLYERIVEIVDQKIGPSFDEERLEAVIADSQRRFAEKIPPALGDEGKSDDRRHGDVILWHQLIDLAKEEKRPVIFVTDDQKDWMWEVKGQLLGPRPELVAEMADAAQQPFHIYSTANFVSHASAGSGTVDQDVLQELKMEPSRAVLIDSAEAGVGWGERPVGAAMDPNIRAHISSPKVFTHSVIGPDGEVHLYLEGRDDRLIRGEITCQVMTPFGESSRLTFHPRTGGRTLPFMLTGFYPREFGAGPVVPGEVYQVHWLGGQPRRKYVIAADAFSA